MLENGVLKKAYGPKRKEVTGEGRRREEGALRSMLLSKCSSDHITKWIGRTCGVLVGRPEGKRTLGKHRHGWEDSIKMDLREVRWTGLMWLRIGIGGGCF